MDKSSDILDKINRKGGMTVPDGYFADFTARMSRQLPERRAEVTPVRRGLWATIRPYVYMAAMFAGVWCMLKMFTIMAGHSNLGSMDSNPVLAEAFSNESFVFDYIYDDINEWDVLDEMMEDGTLDETDSEALATFLSDSSQDHGE